MAGGALLPGLDEGRFHTISADPPWLERGSGAIRRGAQRHYPLVPTAQLPALMMGAKDPAGVPLWRPAANAHLYLWVTNNFLEDGLWLMKELSFRYVTTLPWFKVRDESDDDLAAVLHAARLAVEPPAGVPQLAAIAELARALAAYDAPPSELELRAGIGQYFRGETELLLFGVRGKGMAEDVCTARRDLGTGIIAPHEVDERGKRIHSRKPACSYERIEARSKGPYLEYFARTPRPGWTCWGNEIAA